MTQDAEAKRLDCFAALCESAIPVPPYNIQEETNELTDIRQAPVLD